MASNAAQRAGVSPSSSPRLPSPPPFTEVQFGPKSPNASVSELQLDAQKQDEGAARRIRPGARAADMARGPPFVQLHQLESPFQLQEYLKALYHKLTRDDSNNTSKAVTKDSALELATPPTAADTGETVDRNLWLYELCRFLCSKTTRMIVAFFADSPPCSGQTCPEMRASEWQYLCAVHEPPKSCCAIDYCNHTLDWASNVLTSTKHFPSRLSLGGEGGNAFQSMRQLTNIFRRVYRIYAHAWFQHREVFWTIEAELGLYMFFKTVCDVYQLIPEDNYTIPPEAEGSPEKESESSSSSPPQRRQILQKEQEQEPEAAEAAEPPTSTTVSTGATTRRHKHTPSTGVPVAVIAEGAEDEEEQHHESYMSEPGPAEPSESKSLAPATSSPRSRPKSPGQITLPPNDNPEKAPEDPTPMAVYENNPLSLSATVSKTQPTVSTDVSAAKSSGKSPQTAVLSSHEQEEKSSESSQHTTAEHDDGGEEGVSAADSDAETTILLADPQQSHDDESGAAMAKHAELPPTTSAVTAAPAAEHTTTDAGTLSSHTQVDGPHRESGSKSGIQTDTESKPQNAIEQHHEDNKPTSTSLSHRKTQAETSAHETQTTNTTTHQPHNTPQQHGAEPEHAPEKSDSGSRSQSGSKDKGEGEEEETITAQTNTQV